MDDSEIVATSTRVVYRNNWMTVREDGIRHRNGYEGIYGVVEKPDFAVVLPWADGGFHLVQQFRYPVGQRLWEFPQGGWSDPDAHRDADTSGLARAELREETGLTAGRLEPIGYLHTAYGFATEGMHVWLATELAVGHQELEPSESGLICAWTSEADVWAMIDSGLITDAASVAALALWSRHQVGAAVSADDDRDS